MKKIIFIIISVLMMPVSTSYAEAINPPSTLTDSSWQKTLADSLAATSQIQNSVERNKLTQLLKSLQETTPEAQLSNNNRFIMVHNQAKWEAINKKLQGRLKSAKQNLPDNADKTLIVNILNNLVEESAKMLPTNTSVTTPAAPTAANLTTAEQGRQLYINDLLQTKLPEIKKALGNFSPTIFISYAWGPTEQSFVPTFTDYLRKAGMQVRLDVDHNKVSTEIHTGFVTELETVDYIIVVGSKLYGDKAKVGKNNVVATETRIIAERNKRQPGRILPLLLSGEPMEAFPPFMRDKVFVNFTNPQLYAQELGKIILALCKYSDNSAKINAIVQSINEETTKINNLPPQTLEQRYQKHAQLDQK